MQLVKSAKKSLNTLWQREKCFTWTKWRLLEKLTEREVKPDSTYMISALEDSENFTERAKKVASTSE